MKYNCEMISDLLPLYIDKACTKGSAEAVEQHISECEACAGLLAEMRQCDTVIDKPIADERNNVLDSQARFFKRRSAIAGCIVGGIFAIPILVCLIVNLATGAGLTWFFIVLAALLIPASLTVVPLMAPDNKLLWTIGSFTASLLVLYAVCSIFSGGSWFFIAASATLFGLSIPFMPFVVNAKPVAKLLGSNKALTAIGVMTLAYVLMMTVIGIKARSLTFFRYALAFSLPPLTFFWAMFALIRYPRWNGLLKAAACIFAASLIFFLNDTVVYLILGCGLHFPGFDTSLTTTDSLNCVMCWTVLAAGTVIAAIFAVFGFIKLSKNANKKEISK